MRPRIAWFWTLPPLAAAAAALAHPVIDPWSAGVAGLAPLVDSNTRWLAVHGVLLAAFPLTALSVAQIVRGETSRAAFFARGGLFAFAVLYAAFDTFAGLAPGTICRSAAAFGPSEQATALVLVKSFWSGPMIPALFLAGTAAWLLGLGAVAYVLWRAHAGAWPAALLALAAVLLFLDHPPPFGPVTFGATAAAIAWLTWSARGDEAATS